MFTAAVENLGSRSVLAVFWGTTGAIVRLILQFAAQVVLARILGPEQYGIFAIGAIVISFSNFFSDIGLAYGLIHKKIVTAYDIRFVFTWQIVLGLTVTAVVFYTADGIALFFGDQRAAGVVQALAVICILNALAAPSLNLLKRALDFKRIQIAQIAGFIVGYVVVGIPLACYGSQVWALVAAWVMQAMCVLILTYRATRHPIHPLLYYSEARALGTFGGTVLITNLINWVINNIDRVIIGRVFTSREIGLYATTYNMLQTPTASVLGTVQPVFFAASARIADAPETIARSYRALIAAVVAYLLPVFIAVASVSETFILGIYGPKWHEAVALFTPLALAMPLYLVWGFTTPLLWTGGHASKEFKTQLPLAIVWIGLTWLAAQHSVVTVAWVVLGLFFLRCIGIVAIAAYYLKLSTMLLWRAVRGGLVCSMAVGILVKTTDLVIVSFDPLLRVAIDAVVGAVSLLVVLKLIPCLISSELATLNKRIVEKLPSYLVNKLSFVCREARDDTC